MYMKRYCTTMGVGVGGCRGGSKSYSFTLKFFYVMGKGLSGELSFTWTCLVLFR